MEAMIAIGGFFIMIGLIYLGVAVRAGLIKAGRETRYDGGDLRAALKQVAEAIQSLRKE